jgi:hypothetical protein
VESHGRPDNPARSISQAAGGSCTRCEGLMVVEYYRDLQDDTGQIGITGFRCSSCGKVIDRVILQNRLNQLPDLVHAVKRRKYAQRVGQGESDGQDQNGHGNETQFADCSLVGPAK